MAEIAWWFRWPTFIADMQKLKTAAAILLGLLCFCALLLAVFLYTRSDDDYRQLLVGMVDDLSSYTLTIDGRFALERSSTPSLAVSDLELRSKTSTDRIQIERFSMVVDLWSLLQGYLRIEDLLLVNARFELGGGDERRPGDARQLGVRLPLPIVEQALLQNIRVNIAGKEVTAVDTLKIHSVDEQSVLRIQGQGRYRGRDVVIGGELGTGREGQSGPFPVTIDITAQDASLTLTGVRGQDLDLDLRFVLQVPDLTGLLPAAPPIPLQLRGSGRIFGDYRNPGLSELQLNVGHGQSVLLRASGSIGKLLDLEKMALQLAGNCDDPVFLDWLMPDGLPEFHSAKFTAHLDKPGKRYRLRDIDIYLSSPERLQVKLTGSSELDSAGQGFENLQLTAYLRAPNVASVYPGFEKIVPLPGKVTGRAHIVGGGNALTIGDIQLAVAGRGNGTLQTGGRIELFADAQGSFEDQLFLDLTLNSGSTTVLQPLLGMEIPDFGPLTAQGRLRGSVASLQLQQFELRAGHEQSLLVKTWGKISFDPLQETALQVHVSAASAARAARLWGRDLPEFGVLQASMDVQGSHDVLTSTNLHLQVGDAKSLSLEARGRAEISLQDKSVQGIAVTVSARAESIGKAARVFGEDKMPDFGPVRGRAQISGTLDNLQVRDLRFTAGRKNLLQVAANGAMERLRPTADVPLQGVDIAVALTAADTGSLLKVFHARPVDLGRLSGSARLRDRRKGLSLEDIHLLAGDRQRPMLVMQGEIGDLLGQRKTQLRMDFEGQLLARFFDETEIPGMDTVQGHLVLSGTKDAIGIEDLSLAVNDSDLLEMELTGGMDDILDRDGIHLHGDLAVLDLPGVGRLFNRDLPDLGRIDAAGDFFGGREKLEFKGKIKKGKSDFNVDLAMGLAGKKPEISGRIMAGHIVVKDLGLQAERQKNKSGAGKGSVFSRKRLSLEARPGPAARFSPCDRQ